MKRSKIVRDKRSVLNTDAFDRRRFQEIFEKSEGLQRVRDEGQMPAAEALLGDIWASLYKMKPRLKQDDLQPSLKPNRTILKRLMADEQYENQRDHTKLDDLSAAVCAVSFGEKLNGWLAEAKEQDEELQRLADELETLQHDMADEQPGEEPDIETEAVRELEKAADALHEKLELTLETNGERFAEAMGEALEDTVRVKKSVISLMGGTVAGKGEAELKKVPLRDQLALADQLAGDPKLQEIAEWAGRFKEAVREKQKAEYVEAMERRGVTLGGEIERLLPSELGLYANESTKQDFLRRFAENETMMYDQKKRENLGKGPIVFCLDQSGSMKLLDNQAKGFILALLSIAKKQSRDLCVLLFSTTVQTFIYEKGNITAVQLSRLARTYLGGGTDFTLALTEAMKVIGESRFQNADLIFVTDGEDEVEDSFLETFNECKKKKEFEVLSLVVGSDTDVTEGFSDRVLHVTEFDEEGSFTAFEI